MPYAFATNARRSRNMRAIKASSNATTELCLRAHLVRNRIRGWKLRPKNVRGCPDFFFAAPGVAVFVDGCFWHGCPKCGHTPKTNRPYWSKKLAGNRLRDNRVRSALRDSGIRVVRIWECRLRNQPRSCLRRISNMLTRPPMAAFRR
jgi:DNA mismatch endonuclease, patch repair protein